MTSPPRPHPLVGEGETDLTLLPPSLEGKGAGGLPPGRPPRRGEGRRGRGRGGKGAERMGAAGRPEMPYGWGRVPYGYEDRLPWMNLPPNARYVAGDIDLEMVRFLDGFLRLATVHGHAEVNDLLVAAPPGEAPE